MSKKAVDNAILAATNKIVDDLPVEVLTESEAEQYKEILKRIPIPGEDIDAYLIDQVQLMEDIVNYRFVVNARVESLKKDFAPIRAQVEQEIIAAAPKKPTQEQLANMVLADPRCAPLNEALNICDHFLTQIDGLLKTLEDRSRVLNNKHFTNYQTSKIA